MDDNINTIYGEHCISGRRKVTRLAASTCNLIRIDEATRRHKRRGDTQTRGRGGRCLDQTLRHVAVSPRRRVALGVRLLPFAYLRLRAEPRTPRAR